MTFRQVQSACLLVQERQPACAVEQFQKAPRGEVHRPERHGMSGCHTELHGVPSTPCATQCGLQHRIHDFSPERCRGHGCARRPVAPRVFPQDLRQNAGQRRTVRGVVHRHGALVVQALSRSNGACRGADRRGTVPGAGLPPRTAGNVVACPPTRRPASPGRPPRPAPEAISAARQPIRPALRRRARSRSAGAPGAGERSPPTARATARSCSSPPGCRRRRSGAGWA